MVRCARAATSHASCARPTLVSRTSDGEAGAKIRDPGATRQNRWTVETLVVSPLGPRKSGLLDLLAFTRRSRAGPRSVSRSARASALSALARDKRPEE